MKRTKWTTLADIALRRELAGPAFVSEEAVRIVESLAELVVDDQNFKNRPWDGLTLISQIRERGESLSGYIYTADGRARSLIPQDREALDRFVELRSAMTDPGEPGWKVCRFRIKRADMSVSLDFEYRLSRRWEISDAQIRQSVADLE
ncbi:hypothetical protein AB0N05_38300 [Nocardia sp. NPDC051030]|uniref:hypothetical protein n=1 Tax=Nocardia sp. NPDC051030 TaxID=3155162 RepID=UPI00341BF053